MNISTYSNCNLATFSNFTHAKAMITFAEISTPKELDPRINGSEQLGWPLKLFADQFFPFETFATAIVSNNNTTHLSNCRLGGVGGVGGL